MCRGKLCSHKDDIAAGSVFSLVLDNLSYFMVNFEQTDSLYPPKLHKGL